MTGEEISGPAGPKLLRLLCFVGAGFISVITINKWRQLERKAILQQQQQQRKGMAENSSNSVAVQKN